METKSVGKMSEWTWHLRHTLKVGYGVKREGKGYFVPEGNGVAGDACVASEWYLKGGFASWWVSTKRYNQAKDRRKEGVIPKQCFPHSKTGEVLS